jgi:hypothetical protein
VLAAGKLDPQMSAEELRHSWQGRAIACTNGQGHMLAVLMSLFADAHDETFPWLMRSIFPDWRGVCTPFLCSSPKIDKAGQIVADVALRGGEIKKDHVVFDSERAMEGAFRRLADWLKLDDADRVELFDEVRAWVKADMRLDPTMDRRDPDAKRLVN